MIRYDCQRHSARCPHADLCAKIGECLWGRHLREAMPREVKELTDIELQRLANIVRKSCMDRFGSIKTQTYFFSHMDITMHVLRTSFIELRKLIEEQDKT